MDSDTFQRYCNALGIDSSRYLNAERPTGIAVNRIQPNPDARTVEEQERTIPYILYASGLVSLRVKYAFIMINAYFTGTPF